MHRGAHINIITFHYKKNGHLQPIFATKNYHLPLYWQFLVAKIGYIYNNFSSSVWNHATQVIEYQTFFSLTIELNQNETN